MLKFICISTAFVATALLAPICSVEQSARSDQRWLEQGMALFKVKGVVQVQVRCGIEVEPECVAEFLSKAVEADSTYKKFRVSGSYNMGGGAGTVTALYNRAEGTLKFFETDSDVRGLYISSYLYSNVSDDLIHRLAKTVQWASFKSPKDRGIKRPGACYFDELITYGCKRTGSSRFKAAPKQ